MYDMTTMEHIVRMTRPTDAAWPIIAMVPYPAESVGGRYQHVWSLAQREAWLHGRGERLRILAPQSTQLAAQDLRDFLAY